MTIFVLALLVASNGIPTENLAPCCDCVPAVATHLTAVRRLRDENRMVRLIDKAVQLLESRLPKADDAVIELSTTPHEMCRGYLKQIEHIYYKVDRRIFQQDEVRTGQGFCHLSCLLDFVFWMVYNQCQKDPVSNLLEVLGIFVVKYHETINNNSRSIFHKSLVNCAEKDR